MSGRVTRVGTALLAALVVAATLDLAPKAAAAQAREPGPSELWSEYPLDPAKGETPPPPVAGDEDAAVPPADVNSGRRFEPVAPRGEEEETLFASPVFWVLLVVLLVGGSALAIGATRAMPQAIETVTAVPARIRAHYRPGALRPALSAPARLARRAAADVPQTLSRLAVPAGAPVRLVRRARRPVVTTRRRIEVPTEQRTAREDPGVAETLVERVRGYVALPDRAPDVNERAVVDAGDERCEIRWWRGYLKSQFYACAVTDEGREVVLATSPTFWWRHGEPPSPTKAAVAARMALVEALVARGWRVESTTGEATGAPWFAGSFRYRVRANARASV